MRNDKSKRTTPRTTHAKARTHAPKRSAASRILMLLLAFAILAPLWMPTPWVHAQAIDDADGLEVVETDASRILHKPQEYVTHTAPAFGNLAAQAPVYAGPFEVGDTRDFRVCAHSNADKIVKGKLIAQGVHTNIWVLDDADYHAKTGTTHNSKCHLNDVSEATAKGLVDAFDTTYELMTGPNGFAAHDGVQIRPGFSYQPTVGDLGGDGKVNFLFYDLYGDGGNTGSYFIGFFRSFDFNTFVNDGAGLRPSGWSAPSGVQSNGSFANGLDMLHIDIGDNQGYSILMGSNDERLEMFGTLAHELQHMLFYMYFGVNIMENYQRYAWLDEALSELAATFFVQKGVEAVTSWRMFNGAANEYDGDYNGSTYGDFLNFASEKNYGMGKFFSMFMYKKYGGAYTSGIYEDFKNTYPFATSYDKLRVNWNKISSDGHDKTVGRLLNAGAGIGNGDDTLPLAYFMFMESFAADGGTVYAEGGAVQTIKLCEKNQMNRNLWAIRPSLGTLTFLSLPLQDYKAFPTLASGGSVILSGYGRTVPALGATHDKFYKLEGAGKDAAQYLTINVSDPGASTRYYVAVPNTGSPLGADGASVFALKQDGSDNLIYVGGRMAYLFVVTFHRNVNATVAFSWAATGTLDGASSWAKMPLSAARISDLVPPSFKNADWTKGATRLDAAYTVVRLIERAYGKSRDAIAAEKDWDLSEYEFADTPGDRDVAFLRAAGVTSGTSTANNTFSPERTYIRADFVTMIGRAGEKLFGLTTKGDPPPFSDVGDIAGYARGYVGYAFDNEITLGVGNGSRFAPTNPVTNQEAVIFAYRTFGVWVGNQK